MRKLELDLLRIWGCILVIASHLVCLVVFDLSYSKWGSANLLYVARDACVPIFYVMSGILFLDTNKTFSYKKLSCHIIQLLALYILFCTIFWMIRQQRAMSAEAIINGILNPSHLEFLTTLAGIYFCVPFLRLIVKNKIVLKYFILVWLLFMFGFPFIEMCLNILQPLFNINTVKYIMALETFVAPEFCTYTGYLLLGYYLYYIFKKKIPLHQLVAIWLLSVILPSLINWFFVHEYQFCVGYVWEYFSIFSLLQTSSLLLIFKDHVTKIKYKDGTQKRMAMLSQTTLGIYLIHPFFTERLFGYMIRGSLFITVPLLTVGIFSVSFLFVYMFMHLSRSMLKGIKVMFGKMKQIKDMDKLKCTLFSGLLIFRVIVYTIYNCPMYADGSYAFFECLRGENMWLWPPSRNAATAFSRIFMFILMKTGVKNFNVLAYSYSFGYTVWLSVFLILAVRICYKNHSSKMMNYTISIWGLALAFTGMYLWHESLFTTALCWYLFIFFYHYDKASVKLSEKIFTGALLLASLGGTYESFAFFGATICIYMLINALKNKHKIDWFYAFTFVLVLANGILEVYYTLHPFSETMRTGYLNQIFKLDYKLLFIIAALVLYIGFWGLVYNNKRLEKVRIKIEIALSIILAAYMLYDIEQIVYYTRMARGIFHLILPLGLIAMLTVNMFQQKDLLADSVKIISWVIMISALIVIYMSGYGYSLYLKNLNSITVSAQGFTVWPVKGEREVYTTDWTIPFESIIAQKLYGEKDTVSSVIVQAKENIYFQPFNMWDIDSYYDLSKYGVYYDKEMFTKKE